MPLATAIAEMRTASLPLKRAELEVVAGCTDSTSELGRQIAHPADFYRDDCRPTHDAMRSCRKCLSIDQHGRPLDSDDRSYCEDPPAATRFLIAMRSMQGQPEMATWWKFRMNTANSSYFRSGAETVSSRILDGDQGEGTP